MYDNVQVRVHRDPSLPEPGPDGGADGSGEVHLLVHGESGEEAGGLEGQWGELVRGETEEPGAEGFDVVFVGELFGEEDEGLLPGGGVGTGATFLQ